MKIEGKIISFLGDSITQGVGVSCAENRYPDRIGKKHGAKKINNYGISGTRFAVQQNKKEEIDYQDFSLRSTTLDKESDIIVVFGGTNDFGHGDAPIGTFEDRTPDTFYGACHTIMQNLINEYPTAQKIICTPIHRFTEAEPCSRGIILRDFVNIIKEVAEYYALPVCDLWSISGIQPRVPKIKEMYCPDGLHPNDAGQALLADKIANFILSL